MIFSFHSGQQLLVMPHSETGQPFGIPTRAIRAVRALDETPFWKNADDRSLRDALPRFDAPGVIAPTEENVAAAKLTHALERGKNGR